MVNVIFDCYDRAGGNDDNADAGPNAGRWSRHSATLTFQLSAAQIEFCPRHYPLKIAAQLCRGFKLCFYEIAPNCHRNCWIQYL